MQVERALVLRKGLTEEFGVVTCERAFGGLDVLVREFAEELLRVSVRSVINLGRHIFKGGLQVLQDFYRVFLAV